MGLSRALAGEVRAAVTLLTRVPAGRIDDPGAFARAVWAYPLVGAAVGAAASAAFLLGLPPAVEAVVAVSVQVLLTGALHEDGAADTADGFGASGDAARKLLIMRDSCIGTYGAVALILAFAARIAALAAIRDPLPALAATGALGRGAMLLPVLLIAPARPDGLAARLGRTYGRALVGLALAGALALLLLSSRRALLGCALALGAGWTMAALGRRQVGGYTGDVLGATSVLAECLVLIALAT